MRRDAGCLIDVLKVKRVWTMAPVPIVFVILVNAVVQTREMVRTLSANCAMTMAWLGLLMRAGAASAVLRTDAVKGCAVSRVIVGVLMSEHQRHAPMME